MRNRYQQPLKVRRKRGSYRKKHRNNVSRWHENIVAQLRKARRRTTAIYDSAILCIQREAKRYHGTRR